MTLPPPRDHRISLDKAEAMTARYRETMGPKDVKAGLFPAEVFLRLLSQRGARAIRIYPGRDEHGMLNFVLVAADADWNDMLPGTAKLRDTPEEEDDGLLMENSYPCPIYCGGNDGLNGDK